ncbi:MAG: sulfite exporter TauE/SafE family protein [Oscillospiraceae bacterium]|nr:sulfite exporter TauE/SafE family protein [Oscillospiraceae bacterium]
MDLEWERENPRDNVIAGTVGAFLGSLIGVACIVIFSKLGYVSAVSGVVMAVCAIRGYALLGGKLTRRGAVISGLFILVMTYIATKLCFALAVMEAATEKVSFFMIYQSIGLFLEDSELRRIFLGELALQYLFTLLGSVPTLLSSLRKPVKRPEGPAEPDELPPIQGEFYALRKDWMRPLRLSVFVPLLVIMAISVGGFIATAFIQETRWMTAIVLGGFISGVFLLCWSIPTLRLCNAFHILFVRAGGKLWRVDLQHFCSVQNWWSQSSSKQAAWTCFYESEDGKRKKLRISKGYPDFCPVSGMERSQGPAPARWIFVPLSFLVTAAIIAGFLALDMSIYIGPTWNRPQTSDSTPEANTQPEVKSIPARVPEQITEYEMSEVWFRVDSGFKYSRRTFLDGDTGTLYRACVQYGVDASDAWDTLSQHISEYRISPLYDRFDAVCLDQEPLAPLNETSRYNIVSVYLTDGQVFHTAAVLSDDGTLFTMEAEQDASDRSEDVLANLMFTLESVRFDGPVVTEENYQSRIHVSEVRDCSYMAAAYLKTDLFGHDAFVDVYVPYSDSPIYSSDGRAIRTEAHGLRVYATIVSGENAKAVVDARQQELAAAGQVYEDGVDDEMYREDLDAACKLTVYEENGQKRQAVLYADSKWEGYYLLREITGLPELVDEEYPAALKELEGIIGLTMPVLEELGGS